MHSVQERKKIEKYLSQFSLESFILEESNYLEAVEGEMVRDVDRIAELYSQVSESDEEYHNEDEPPREPVTANPTQVPWFICKTTVESEKKHDCM